MRKKMTMVLLIAMLGAFIPLGNVFAVNYSYVRVKVGMGGATSTSVKVTGQYGLLEYPGYVLESGKTYSVSVSGSQVSLDGSGMAPTNKLTFVMYRDDPSSDWVNVSNTARGSLNYKGNLEFSVEGGSLFLVDRVYIDQYVMGVMAAEMSNSWPLEALKAQAIAARTYVASRISTSGKYDVVDTTANQAFNGYNVNWSNIMSAVEATAGVVLKYNGAISDGVYSASNGGQTSLPTWQGWSYNTYHQYKKDEYDLRNPSSPKVEILLPLTEGDTYNMDTRMMTILQSKAATILGDPGVTVLGVSDMVLHDYDAVTPARADGDNAYLFARITVNARKSDSSTVSQPVEVSLAEIKTAFEGTGQIAVHKLMYKDMTADGKAIKLILRKYGHGVGMSQRGAQQMANEGKDVNFIMDFYYPNNAREALPVAKESLKSQVYVYTTRILKSGITGEDVAQLQQRLTNLGLYSGSINGTFDAATKTAVIAFQNYNGLAADGIVGPVTLDRLNSDLACGAPATNPTTPTIPGQPYINTTRTLKAGVTGTDVGQLQQRLQQLGLYSGAINNSFDAATKNAVVSFQNYNGLKADGIVGPATLDRLNSDAACGAPPATNPTTPTTPGLSYVNATRTLKAGVTGADVGQLQLRLQQLGLYSRAINNSFDAATKAAVVSFQSYNGLKADGIVGPATLARLNSDLACGAPPTTNPTTPTIPGQSYVNATRTLKMGLTGTDIGQLQQRLQQLGLYSGTINNNFNAVTKASVVSFQNYNGLKADGIVGPATLARLNSDLACGAPPSSTPTSSYINTTRTIRQGMSGEDVRQLQQRLAALGHYTKAVDGIFGSGTRAAVVAFQRANGLTADGVVGVQTLRKLNA